MTAKHSVMGSIILSGVGIAASGAPADPPVPPGMAGELIAHYNMKTVPQEGSWFSLSYAGDDQIDGAALPNRYRGRMHAARRRSRCYCYIPMGTVSA